jgi:hypothetical protein
MLTLAPGLILPVVLLAQHGAFQTASENGRPVATYYADEPHVRAAFDQMSDYFPRLHGRQFRVYEDRMLPLDLKELDHQPSTALMRRWAVELYQEQDPRTGLLPLRGPSSPSERLYTILDQSQCMFLTTMGRATVPLEWFPDDAGLRKQSEALADGFLKWFAAGDGTGGLFSAVRADTGFPESDLANVSIHGTAIEGLARVGTVTGRPDLLDAAKRIARWIGDFSMRYTRGIVPEKFHASGGVVSDLSSDGIYWIRSLGEAYRLTKDPFYRELILRHGAVYVQQGWSEEFGHFSTHIEVDADGFHPAGSMYGDTKYNYPFLLCLLTRLTGDPAYMQRFDALWGTYRREGHDGWMPNALARGRRVDFEGQPREDPNQAMYLEILLDAYDTTGQEAYLSQAAEWADSLLTPDGRKHWRGDSIGTALLRYARRAGLVARLEVQLPEGAPTALSLQASDGAVPFSAIVPTPIAVFYVAPGVYGIRAAGWRDEQVTLAAGEQRVVRLTR